MAPSVRVLSLTTTAGLLKDVVFEPAPGLTCLIGDPGSGKSTVIETLRFVMNHDPRWVNMLLGRTEPNYGPNHPEFGHLKATLAGGSAICRVLVDYGSTQEVLRIERNASDHAPRVYKDGTDEPADHTVLECVEIYSQGDIQRIAEDARRRLALLDRRERADVDAIRGDLRMSTAQTNEIDVEYAVTGEVLETHDVALTHFEERKQKLEFARKRRPQAPPELEAERAKYDRRRLLLEALESCEAVRLRVLPKFADVGREEPSFREALRALSEHALAEAREIEGAFSTFANLLQTVASAAQLQKTVGARPLIEKLRVRFEEQNRPYHKLQEQQQQLAVALKEEDLLRAEVQRLEKTADEKKRTEESRADLQRRREALRAETRRLKSKLYRLRQRLAHEINEEFKDLVKIVVHEDVYAPPEYRRALVDLLYGCKFQKQEQLAEDLAKVPPAELITAVEERDSKFLAEHLNRDRAQMERLIDWLGERQDRDIYALENFVLEDDLEILLNENGRWRPIRELSRGKKALALLPIILMDGKDLLAADQLEDAINNRLVMQTLVARSQGLKRQVILVTHNANIALLTRADRVVVLHDEGGSVRALSGTVKDEGTRYVLDLLEGGPSAFKRRMELYGDLLGDGDTRDRNRDGEDDVSDDDGPRPKRR